MLSSLSAIVGNSDAGETIYLRADQGAYPAATVGLAAGHITIRGVDLFLQPMKAVIRGNRGYNDGRDPPWTLPTNPEQQTVVNFSDWTHGPKIFTLQAGANDLTFRDIRFEHVGIAFSVTASIKNLTVFDSEAYNIRRFLEMSSGIGPTGFSLHDISVIGASKHVFRMRGTANNWAFANITINCGYQTGDNFARGIGISETAHDVTLTDISVDHCIEDNGKKFWQGDGISTERDNTNITITRGVFTNNGDGGLDLKSVGTTVNDAISYNNKINYKIWSRDITLNDVKYGDTIDRGGVGGRQVFRFTGALVNATVIHPIGISPLATAGQSIFTCVKSGGRVRISDTSDLVLGGAHQSKIAAGCTLLINP